MTVRAILDALQRYNALNKDMLKFDENGNLLVSDEVIELLSNALASKSIDALLVDIHGDNVGLAKDTTVNSILNELIPVKADGSVTAANNTAGLTVTLNKGGRPYVNLKYSVGGACEIYVETSDDGVDWYELDYIATDSAAKKVEQYPWVGDAYIRARSPTTGIDITFKLMAGR